MIRTHTQARVHDRASQLLQHFCSYLILAMSVFPGMERHVVVLSSTKLISVFAECGWLQVSEVSSN